MREEGKPFPLRIGIFIAIVYLFINTLVHTNYKHKTIYQTTTSGHEAQELDLKWSLRANIKYKNADKGFYYALSLRIRMI